MSTRTSKKSTTKSSKSTSSGVETPKAGKSTPSSMGSSSKSRSSPLSPTRISRLQEKADLQNLNDRLAAYIDRVRHLELENNRLNVQVETIQESVHKEVISMKGMYEQELSDARKLLDDTAKDKAQLQIDVGKFKTENEELKMKLSKKERDLHAAEKALTSTEAQVNDLSSKVNILEAERKKHLAELRDLRDEVNKLTRQLSEAKKQLESETLMRVDLENRCQSLKEELQFKQQIFEKEVSETKSKKMVEISEIDGRLQEEYETKLQEALQELRDQYEDQLRYNRSEVEGLYENKIEDLNKRLNRGVSDADGMVGQLKDSRTRISELTSRLSYLESTSNTLQQRVNDLEAQLDSERDMHLAEVSSLKDELEALRDQMTQQLQEYQDLMDIKIALDMEISAYRKLLESEEARLNLTPSTKKVVSSLIVGERETPIRRTPLRGMKRKRAVVEEDITKSAFKSTSKASGALEIIEECPQGKFIRIENKGNKNMTVGGYRLVRIANGVEQSYDFHRQLKMPANSITTIWSMNCGQTHEAPHNLVMKSQEWNVADFMTTRLFNSDEEEIAMRESNKEHESISSIQYGGQKRMSGGQSPDKCSVM